MAITPLYNLNVRKVLFIMTKKSHNGLENLVAELAKEVEAEQAQTIKVSEGVIEPTAIHEASVIGIVVKADKAHKTDMTDEKIQSIAIELGNAFTNLQASVHDISIKIDKLMNDARNHYYTTYKFIPEMNSANRIYKFLNAKLLTETSYASSYINNLLSRFKKCWNENRAFSTKDPIKEGNNKGAKPAQKASKGEGSQAGQKGRSEAENALADEVIRLDDDATLLKSQKALTNVFGKASGSPIKEEDGIAVLEALLYKLNRASNAGVLSHLRSGVESLLEGLYGEEEEEEESDE